MLCLINILRGANVSVIYTDNPTSKGLRYRTNVPSWVHFTESFVARELKYYKFASCSFLPSKRNVPTRWKEKSNLLEGRTEQQSVVLTVKHTNTSTSISTKPGISDIAATIRDWIHFGDLVCVFANEKDFHCSHIIRWLAERRRLPITWLLIQFAAW